MNFGGHGHRDSSTRTSDHKILDYLRKVHCKFSCCSPNMIQRWTCTVCTYLQFIQGGPKTYILVHHIDAAIQGQMKSISPKMLAEFKSLMIQMQLLYS